ncbi:MAG TPA: RagB/SusD family nutrient uptake outer membrane protein [Chitinophagaceae bacterium]|nr:RagB/SusD family nutrient uptake outer membrane protein [Chitinophagaceae bacterium]
MKKIALRLVAISIGVIVGLGCNKNPLDITPDGRMSLDDVFKNPDRTEGFLNTVYSSIPSYFFSYIEYAFLAPSSDEASDSQVGNQPANISAQWIIGALNPSNNPLTNPNYGKNADHYPAFWTGIRNANVFLANIDNAVVSSELYRPRFKAEAKLLRAFYYWELIKQFGPMPIVSEPFTNTFDYTSLVRPTFQADIDFIIKDCDDAIAEPTLPIRLTTESERGRFSKAVAYAIKSEATLYNASPLWNAGNDVAKWQAAAAQSKQALTALTAGGQYALAGNYENYFISYSDLTSSPLDKETIFEVAKRAESLLSYVNSIPSKPTYKAGTCPSQELVDSYDMQATGEPAITGYNDAEHLHPIINSASGYDETKPFVGRDPRFYATVWFNGAVYDNIGGQLHTIQTYLGGADQLIKNPPNQQNTHTGYYLRKFIDPKIQNGQVPNAGWKKYRLAELYLNYAEAENEASGATADVYSAINTVRRRVSMPDLPGGLSKDEMRKRIRNERRVELSIEEHRFWDVRRWKILDQTDKLVTGMEVIKNPNNTFSYNRFITEQRNAWQEKYLLFPIPIGEAAIIPDFNTNQNAGW